MTYRDRGQAGRELAGRLAAYAGRPGTLVLALARGGVPVGFEIAAALHLPLDVFVVRKLGAPDQPELALGAIASGGVVVTNRAALATLGISDSALEPVAQRERRELERREAIYRAERPGLKVSGQTVILVDDGLATGSSMRAAVEALRRQGAAKIVVAVPVAAEAVCDEFRALVEEVVCGATPRLFYAVGQWYQDFPQVSDEEVRSLLRRANLWQQPA